MTGRAGKRGFASRPGDAESWIKAPDAQSLRADATATFTARLTIDNTPASCVPPMTADLALGHAKRNRGS